MLKSYRTEIDPSSEQIEIIQKTVGVCRYVYNLYIARNKEIYESGGKFISGRDFSVWLNNEYIPVNPDKAWIREVSSKSVKQSIMDADAAYRKFFKHLAKFPRFKKKGVSDPKMYFVKTDAKAVIRCERHRIKIPTLGWVKLKEKGYIPVTESGKAIKSGTVSKKAGRYYVSVLVEEPDIVKPKPNANEGIGIDLGVKDFAVLSNGDVYKNINKTAKIRRLEKKLRREQRSLSRKFETRKKLSKEEQKGGSCSNIAKQKLKVQKLHQRIESIRTDYINKCICRTAKTKPSYITIEDLNVKGMMKNRHLSKAVAGQKFYEFRTKLTAKCNSENIELRIVDPWYPSSRMCHNCGSIKKDLKLSDRVYRCPVCGAVIDRDYQASLNLRDAKVYKIAI